MAYVLDSQDTPITGKDDWKVISLVGVAHAGSHFFQLVIPSLYVSLGAAFGLDFAQLGLLVSVFFVVSGLGQASSGFVVDRLGARPVLWFGLACFVVSALLIGAATGYPMLLLAAAMGGVGNSVFHPADFSILNNRVSSGRLGHAFSMHGLTGSLGWAVAPLFITGLTLLVGWRMAAFGAAALLGAILLATMAWGRLLAGERNPGLAADAAAGAASSQAPEPGVWQTLKTLLASPALWGAFLFFGFTSMALSAIQNYTLPILGEFYQVSAVAASSALSSYMVASACGMLAGGFLASANPHTERVVALAFISGGGLLVALATQVIPAALAIPALAAAGFCSGVAGPSRDMLIRRVTPRKAMGSVYGLVYSGMDAGAAIAPLLFGLMLDGGFRHGPWIGAGMAFWVAALLAAHIARIARRNEALAAA